jgi:acyl-CoA dehydrogenase
VSTPGLGDGQLRLSTADLPMFFAAHHGALADRLIAAAPAIAACEEAGPDEPARDRAAVAALAEAGLFALVAPADGQVHARDVCLAREMLGWASPRADSIFAVQGLGTHPLLLAGSPSQKALLPALARGSLVAAFALTEPEAGSDVASISTRAARSSDGSWQLYGEKVFISNLGVATHATVFATVDPGLGHKGITAFWVPLDAPNVVVERLEVAAPHPIGRLDLQGVMLPAEALIGTVGGGFRLAMATLDTFRVTVGAAAVGMARRALDAALGHVRTRQQFGKPLAEQPLVQAHLADMAVDLDAARLLVLRAAYLRDTSSARVTTEVAMAKLHATEAAQRIIDTAVQLHGGKGVLSGAVVEHLYRAIRPLRIYEGTSEIQRTIIGRALAQPK